MNENISNLLSLSQIIIDLRIVFCKESFRRVFLIKITRFSQFSSRPFGALDSGFDLLQHKRKIYTNIYATFCKLRRSWFMLVCAIKCLRHNIVDCYQYMECVSTSYALHVSNVIQCFVWKVVRNIRKGYFYHHHQDRMPGARFCVMLAFCKLTKS